VSESQPGAFKSHPRGNHFALATQRIIRAAFITMDTNGMNRATVAHHAKPLLLARFIAHGLVRRQNFVPILIGLVHRIDLALVARTQLAGSCCRKEYT